MIPHHNTPDLLQRLVGSIPQREDIEIIVVDDNSDVDKKANISRPDVNIIFIGKEHTRGAGKARNVGMDAAVGKWLLFADSDDFYASNFIDILDEYKDEDIDVLFYNISSADPETDWRARNRQLLLNQYDGTEDTANNLLFFTYAPWARMFNTAFVKRYGIRYEEIARTNDVFFSLQVSYFLRKFKVEKRPVYVVSYYGGSLTSGKITKTKYSAQLLTYKRMSKLFKYMGHSDWNVSSIKGRYSQSVLKHILKIYKRQKITGIEAFFYYLTHWLEFKNKAHYYVNVIKDIENRVKIDK